MKNSYTNKVALAPGEIARKSPTAVFSKLMNLLIKVLTKLGLLRKDLDYHLVRASMVIIEPVFHAPHRSWRAVFELPTFRRADSKGGQPWHKQATNF
jgi:hypothetical protein